MCKSVWQQDENALTDIWSDKNRNSTHKKNKEKDSPKRKRTAATKGKKIKLSLP
jgi:hypothetical protein